jgi:hypothetical protein
MKFFVTLALILSCLGLSVWQVHAMSSVSFSIPWDNVNSGGNDQASSLNYAIYDTVGQPAAGVGTSTLYSLEEGYRADSNSVSLSFVLRGQSATQTTYSTFSAVSSDVTVAATTGFAVGDYIAVVENVGFGQLVAVGRISQIIGTTLLVDQWGGQSGLMSAVPTGGNDVVYRLGSTDAVSFGTATVGNEHVALASGSIFSSASSGHSVYIQANQLLQTPSAVAMTTVSDGTVSSNAEEYGAEVVGAHAVGGSTDMGVTTTQRTVLLSTTPAITAADRFALLFKLGITSATTPGNYGQTVYFTLTANF